MGLIRIDPIFQVAFEAYSLTLGGHLALARGSPFREPLKPGHAFRVAGKISGDSWYPYQELFLVLDNKNGTWRSVSAVAPCQFLSSAWQILVRDKRYVGIADDPEVQFLRHVRNAAAHGNRFNIDPKLMDNARSSLRKKASWRGREIAPALDGTPLIPDFMELGDPVWLISDISQLLKAA